MDKNCVKRRGAPDELASDSKVPKGSKRLYVNAARVRGKRSHLIRGGLRRVLKGTERLERSSDRGVEVSRGRSSRWSNDHPRRAEKSAYRAKGRTSSGTSTSSSAWDEQGRQNTPDRGTTGQTKRVKPVGLDQRVEQSPARDEGKASAEFLRQV
jgi:hypothetical protein